MTPIKRVLRRDDVERRPELAWNAFVDILAQEDSEDLSPIQRVAHLAFWYDAEVQNGGHGQYFDTMGLAKARETVDALELIGLRCQANALRRALESVEQRSDHASTAFTRLRAVLRWLGPSRSKDLRSANDVADQAYDRCSPTVIEALEQYLARHRREFLDEQP